MAPLFSGAAFFGLNYLHAGKPRGAFYLQAKSIVYQLVAVYLAGKLESMEHPCFQTRLDRMRLECVFFYASIAKSAQECLILFVLRMGLYLSIAAQSSSHAYKAAARISCYALLLF